MCEKGTNFRLFICSLVFVSWLARTRLTPRPALVLRDVEMELEVVWQAATRENQQMKESLLGWKPSGGLDGPPAADQASASATFRLKSGFQTEALLSLDAPLDEKQKNGLDFYC